MMNCAYQKSIEDTAGKVAEKICIHAWKVILAVILLNGALGFCLINIRVDYDMDYLFLPSSKTTTEKERLKKLFIDEEDEFHPYASIEPTLFAETIVQLTPKVNENKTLLEEMDHIVSFVSNISVKQEEKQMFYTDLCAKHRNICAIYVIVEGSSQMIDYDNSNSAIDSDRNVTTTSFFKLRFYLKQNDSNSAKLSKLWQARFIYSLETFSSKGAEIYFAHSRSLFEEIDNDTYPDIRIFGLCFTIFITITQFMISGGDCVSKQSHIGRIGSLVTPLSILGAWGLLTACGVDFVNFVGVMPFVASAYEMNNVMLTLSSLSDNVSCDTPEKRVRNAVKQTFLPVSMTTFIHVVSFCFGIWTNLPILRTFCLFAAVTFLFIYVNHVVFFTACLAVHERRIQAGRHCCTCKPVLTPDDPGLEGKSGCFICCCTGRRPQSRKDTENEFDRIPGFVLTRAVLLKYSKWLLLIVAVSVAGLCIWQILLVKFDVVYDGCVTERSYLHTFLTLNAKYFPGQVFFTIVIDNPSRNLWMCSNGSQVSAVIEEFSTRVLTQTYIDSNFSINWFEEFCKSECSNYIQLSKFEDVVETCFLRENPDFKSDVSLISASKEIIASRIYFKSLHMPSTAIYIDLMSSLDRICRINNISAKLTVYSADFIYIEEYFNLVPDTLKIIVSRVCVTVVLSCLFIPSPVIMMIFVLIFTLSIFLCTAGALVAWNVVYTPIVLVVVVVASVYATQAAVHICFFFVAREGTEKSARVAVLLRATCVQIFNISFVSSIALLVLIAAKSYVFVTVFKVLLISNICTCLHSGFFIPAVLLAFGPSAVVPEGDQDKKDSGSSQRMLEMTKMT